MSNPFLTREEIKELTARSFKSLQIERLRKMGVPFFVNVVGHPVVARSAIEGRGDVNAEPVKKKWEPKE